jgi:Sulfotransferase domain
MGHCMAVTDIPAVIFAGELLDAYPEAKVILNRRSDIMEWKKSFRATTLAAERSWVMWICSFFNSELFWMQSISTLIIQTLFEGDFESNAEIAYLRHYEKLEEKLKRLNRDYLDWEAQQGWEPLCNFLGNDIPRVEFPRKNARAEHDHRIAELVVVSVDPSEGRWRA